MKPFVFIHTPRTAGGSLNQMLRKYHKDDLYQRNDTFIGDDKINVDFDKAREYKVISGHFFYDRVKHLKRPKITFLRDPVERVISMWMYLQKWAPGRLLRLEVQFGDRIYITDFIKRTGNMLYKYTGGNLSVFDYVGDQKNADMHYKALAKMFDFTYEKQERVHITTKDMEFTGWNKSDIRDRFTGLIEKYNKKDIELYNGYLNYISK